METPIEKIWKEGFAKDRPLKTPSVGNMSEQKSINLVDKFKRKFKVYMVLNIVMAIVFWVIFFFQGAIWPGTIAAALMFGLAWYGRLQMKLIQELDPGMSSYDYL